MSTYFSKVIKAGEKLREFNFRLATLNDDSNYLIDVPDDKGNRIKFSMYRDASSHWKISSQLMPMWIHDTAPQLAAAIEENLEAEMVRRK